jgi:hypothetical protein
VGFSVTFEKPVMISITSRATPLLLIGLTSSPHLPAAIPVDTGISSIYELTVETGMPHLEENLRYATTYERRCATLNSLFTAFPVLKSAALTGCQLTDPERQDDLVSSVLTCSTGHGITGQAIWRLGANRARGTLNVKLGGKNMTFYQRITVASHGPCVP